MPRMQAGSWGVVSGCGDGEDGFGEQIGWREGYGVYGGVRWEYCLEDWGAKSYFWGVLSKGVRRDIIGVSIELLFPTSLLKKCGSSLSGRVHISTSKLIYVAIGPARGRRARPKRLHWVFSCIPKEGKPGVYEYTKTIEQKLDRHGRSVQVHSYGGKWSSFGLCFYSLSSQNPAQVLYQSHRCFHLL